MILEATLRNEADHRGKRAEAVDILEVGMTVEGTAEVEYIEAEAVGIESLGILAVVGRMIAQLQSAHMALVGMNHRELAEEHMEIHSRHNMSVAFL